MQKLGQRGKLKGNWVIQQTGICWQGKSHKISRAMVSMWKRNMALRCDPLKKYLTDIKPSNGGARKRVSWAKFQKYFLSFLGLIYPNYSIFMLVFNESLRVCRYARRGLIYRTHQEPIETIGVINVEGHLINLMVHSYQTIQHSTQSSQRFEFNLRLGGTYMYKGIYLISNFHFSITFYKLHREARVTRVTKVTKL